MQLVNDRIRKFFLSPASLHIYDGHLGLVNKADELGPLVPSFQRRAR